MALLTLGLLLITGLLAGLGAERVGLPRVAAYILTGVIFSPTFLGGLWGIAVGEWAEPFTAAALGIIAYLIGGSVSIKQIRRLGRIILWGTLGQSLGALVVVALGVILFLPEFAEVPTWQLALAFGVLATTTAPAGTVAVIHQYRASGTLITTLLGVVALDDALGVVLFSLLLVIADSSVALGGVGFALVEISLSLVLGGLAGWLISRLFWFIPKGAMRLPLVIGTILLLTGLAEVWHLSPLLTAMALGFFARLTTKATADRLFHPVERLEEMVLITFFTIAGSLFEPVAFVTHWPLVLAYVVARVIGKMVGAEVGARFGGATAQVAHGLGLGLIPQAGVAVGLALTLTNQPQFSSVAGLVVNVILAATIINELVGPLTTKMALQMAGELGKKRKKG